MHTIYCTDIYVRIYILLRGYVALYLHIVCEQFIAKRPREKPPALNSRLPAEAKYFTMDLIWLYSYEM